MAQTVAHLVDHVMPPAPVRQWVILVPKRVRGMLADRRSAVPALARIFVTEIERLLCAAAGVTNDANTPTAARPRLGAVFFADMLAWESSGFSIDASVRKAAFTRHHTDCLGQAVGPAEGEFPLECPNSGSDIRLVAFITEPGPIRKILPHLREPLEPPPLALARGPLTAWGELVQVHDDRDVFQASPDELPAIDIRRL